MKKRNGFTLVELLIVMTILAILMVMAVGILNPIALVNRGKDAQRKKDLKTIKIAFEEYFNDKGCYPNQQDVDTWNVPTYCNSASVPYLSPWPCDPSGQPYFVLVPSCTKFKVITNLQNKKDKDIPTNWYEREDMTVDGYIKDQVNYGVSSSNILWYDTVARDYSMCNTEECNAMDGDTCETRTDCEGGDNCWYSTPGCDNPSCEVALGYSCHQPQ